MSVVEQNDHNETSSNSASNVTVGDGSNAHIGHNVFHGTVNQNFQTNHTAAESNYKFGVNLNAAPELNPSKFIGRRSELEELDRELSPDKNTTRRKVVVLSGFGGLGKTQLAAQYATDYQSVFDSVFWVDAETIDLLIRSYLSIAERIGLLRSQDDLQKDDERSTVFLVRQWLSNAENKRWLLIFDNYDDPWFKSGQSYDIRPFFPSNQGSILITTRCSGFDEWYEISLKKLTDDDEGIRILETRSLRSEIRKDVGSQELVSRLDGLPLALVTAGSYLRRVPITCTEFIKKYEDSFGDFKLHEQSDCQRERRCLYTTWNVSYAKLQEVNMNAANLLRLIAYFANYSLSRTLFFQCEPGSQSNWFQELMEEDNLHSAISDLYDFSFIDIDYKSQSFSLHKCVHDWTWYTLNYHVDTSCFQVALKCLYELKEEIQFQDPRYFVHHWPKFRERISLHTLRNLRLTESDLYFLGVLFDFNSYPKELRRRASFEKYLIDGGVIAATKKNKEIVDSLTKVKYHPFSCEEYFEMIRVCSEITGPLHPVSLKFLSAYRKTLVLGVSDDYDQIIDMLQSLRKFSAAFPSDVVSIYWYLLCKIGRIDLFTPQDEPLLKCLIEALRRLGNSTMPHLRLMLWNIQKEMSVYFIYQKRPLKARRLLESFLESLVDDCLLLGSQDIDIRRWALPSIFLKCAVRRSLCCEELMDDFGISPFKEISNHFDLATELYHSYLYACFICGSLSEAQAFLDGIIESQISQLGIEHPFTLLAYEAYAACFFWQENESKGLSMIEVCEERATRLLGSSLDYGIDRTNLINIKEPPQVAKELARELSKEVPFWESVSRVILSCQGYDGGTSSWTYKD